VPTYRDEAIALRTIRLGEADRIVTFLTPEHGKVRAVAKGVRKSKSRIGSRVEPLSHVALLCWRGRELDVVSQAETLDAFRGIREDLSLLGTAMAMLEIGDQVAQEHHAAPDLFALMLNALRTLERTGSPVVLGAFCFKLLALEGVGPITASCATCGSPGPLVAFDAAEGGLLCATCRRGQSVSPDVVELVQNVLSGGLARALEDAPIEAVPAFERLATSAVEHHLDRRLRATRQLYGPREHNGRPRVSSPDDEHFPAGQGAVGEA
jgi:DNA repair protein RecO (recombination protein O)